MLQKLTALLYIFSVLSAHSQQLTGDSIIKAGIQFYDEQRYAEAIARFKLVNENDSSYNKMLAEMALTYLAMHKYDSAIIMANNGLSLPGSNHKHLLRTKGTAYDHLGDTPRAIETYQQAIERYPHSSLLHYNLGVTYLGAEYYDKAQSCFQEALRCNPYHASSHMQLGKLVARQKQYTRAMLSLETFLALEPNSSRSNQVLVFVENLSNGYIDTTQGHFIEPIEDNKIFGEVDHYIKSRIVLTDRYSLPIGFNASLVKQTDMLFKVLPLSDSADDFWIKMYFPFIKAIKEEGHLKPFLYTLLRSTEHESITKYVSKNEDILKKFYQTGSQLSKIKQRRLTHVTGILDTLDFAYFDDGKLYSIGNSNTEGKEEGDWRYYHSNGELNAIGVYKDGKKQGEWRYYNSKAQLETVEYLTDGKLNGIWTKYHTTGKESVRAPYSNGEVNGKVEWFDEFGNRTGLTSYTNSLQNGQAYNYFANGIISESFTYKDGKFEGNYESYFANGKIHHQKSYSEGKTNGKFKEYHPNGILASDGQFKDDKEQGEWRNYYSDGNLKDIRNLKDGELVGAFKAFYRNGNLKIETFYNEQGNLHGLYNSFDEDGKLYMEEVYDNGIIIKVSSISESGERYLVSENPEGTFSFLAHDSSGRKTTSGSFKAGKFEGKWTSYFKNGWPKQTSYYKNGELDGEVTIYHANANIKEIYIYKNGILNGAYKQYSPDGTLVNQGFYKDGYQDNTWTYRLSDGSLESTYYFLKGDIHGWLTNYDVEGIIENRRKYLDGKMLIHENYDIHANRINSTSLLEQDRFMIMRDSNYINAVGHIKGGYYEGDLIWDHPNGRTLSKRSYLNHKRHGEYFHYYANGSVKSRESYLNGKKVGKGVKYYENGNLKEEVNYFNGEKDAEAKYYDEDKTLELTENYRNGELHGDVIQYDISGDVIIKLIFEENELMAYQYLKNGLYTDTIPITNGDYKIEAYFNNGKKSYEQSFKNFLPHGDRIKYYSNGKIRQKNSFKNGMLNGQFLAYYPNGKKKLEYFNIAGMKNGKNTEFFESGKPKKVSQYKRDELHGVVKNYNQSGKIISIEKWWSGKFIGYEQ
ncbi:MULTISPECIES: tetratricopeptide repeat protein [unclassified Saccharicrinis]|uniref:tetratricopeptide repeat protein n=1 Tax=unclassified Saccharicrinis TaxID=2646859 RepID=UPI003D3554B4